MPNETTFPPCLSRIYAIIVEGKIGPGWSEWLGGMQVAWTTRADGTEITILRGTLSDQAALRGVLNRLWDLNLLICSVQQIDPEDSDLE